MRARHFLGSTNGAIFGKPDQEAIARVIAGGKPGGEVWFNFRTPRTEIWASAQLQSRYSYVARFPSIAGAVTTVNLSAKE